MLRVFTAQHPAEAHHVAGLLEVEGIPAEVRGEALSSLIGGVPPAEAYPSVWILEDALASKARSLIERFAKGELVLGTQWQCPECGEVHEPPFTSCWKCGTSQPT